MGFYSRARKIVEHLFEDGYTFKQVLIKNCLFLKDHKDYVKKLLYSMSAAEYYLRYAEKTNTQPIIDKLSKINGDLSEDLIILIKTYCYGMTSMTCEWILEKNSISVEHLADLMIKAIPEELRIYLFREEHRPDQS